MSADPTAPTLPRPSRAARLSLVVFLAGAGGLAVEICASRLLAPYFGSSTVVWANIIGLILLYLSLGYWLGGKAADRRPQPHLLGAIIMAAALCIAALPFISRPLLAFALTSFDSLSVGAVVASFFSTLLLFAVPVTLLGSVSPFALRLAIDSVENAGRVSGRLYALSTLGSILGTFIPALIAIPLIGTQRTLIATALLLTVAASVLLGLRALAVAVLIAAMLALPTPHIKEQPGIIAEAESAYQYVQVVQQASGERDLQLNEGLAVHSEWRPASVLTGGEWDMFLVVPALLSHPVQRVLILGNAGGTTSRAYARYYPHAVIDGVEIDPDVTAIGTRYFGLRDNPRLTVFTQDGRTFLETTKTRYDVIIADAYRQPYVPFQMATEQFFALCRDHLTPGGIVALNVENIPGDSRLSDTIESTVAAVMPHAAVWQALHFNELVVASADAPLTTLRQPMASDISVLGELYRNAVRAAARNQPPMTDDLAPIEWITDRSLLHYIASGGAPNSSGLPTQPTSSPAS